MKKNKTHCYSFELQLDFISFPQKSEVLIEAGYYISDKKLIMLHATEEIKNSFPVSIKFNDNTREFSTRRN